MQGDMYSRRQVMMLAGSAAAMALLPKWTLADDKSADPRADFFKNAKPPTIEIEFSKEDMESLRKEPRKYVKGQLKENGQTVYKDVGFHVKGAAGSTRSIDDKPGLTLNFDKFTDAQRFHGMDKMHLNNSVQDPAYSSDLICGELFRSVGVPASLITHATVSINGQKRGLYVLKEGFDKQFLKNHFGNSSGNFYDGGFLRDIDQTLEMVKGKENKDQPEIKALADAAREQDKKKRLEKMEKALDLNQFASYLAMEVVTWDWDGYPLNRNNYRLYFDPKSKKVTFIPSGMDQMFGDPNGPLMPGFQGMLARAFMEMPEGKQRYLTKMAEILKDKFDPPALLKRLDQVQEKIQPVMASVDPGAAKDLPNQINRLRSAIPQRYKTLQEQLKREKI